MKMTIEKKCKYLGDGESIYDTLPIKITNGCNNISIEDGDAYDIDTIIRSWVYAHNLDSIKSSTHELEFSDLLDVISLVRLPTGKLKLPWYTRVSLLVEWVENKK